MKTDHDLNVQLAPAKLRWWVVCASIAGAIAVMPFDLTLARFFMSDPFPGEFRSFIHKTEVFGHAYGILGIVFTIYLVSDRLRRYLPRVLACALLAGLACDAGKLLVQRVRPVDFNFEDGAHSFLGFIWQAESIGQVFDSAYQSFPSAHSATAVAFALALGWMFPKALRWFLFLAITCAASRFDGGAHYVSDTLIGGMIGYVIAHQVLQRGFAQGRFTAYEEGRAAKLLPLARRPQPPTTEPVLGEFPGRSHAA